MKVRIEFLLSRISERLWVKPLLMCVLSIVGVFAAKMADRTNLGARVPVIGIELLEKLLTIMSSSMLVIATFAVASMVSSYASASSTATPRSFSLVIADDVSQNALSTFIGAFIFSIVAIIVLKNGYYDIAGRFALFILTVAAFTTVILTFVTWVDRIARLGRLGATIDKVEAAARAALRQRKLAPTLRCTVGGTAPTEGQAIYSSSIGYVQRIDAAGLQSFATNSETRISVTALPGTFVAPGRVLAYVVADSSERAEIRTQQAERCFIIADDRTFDEDPRFGLIVLSEIAARALSPAVNDSGTAIDVIGTLVRLFAFWCEPMKDSDQTSVDFDRVAVPELSLEDMFDDAFTAIARDGSGAIEVAGRLQKAFESLASMEDTTMRNAAMRHARLALARAERTLEVPEDLEIIRNLAGFARADTSIEVVADT